MKHYVLVHPTPLQPQTVHDLTDALIWEDPPGHRLLTFVVLNTALSGLMILVCVAVLNSVFSDVYDSKMYFNIDHFV